MVDQELLQAISTVMDQKITPIHEELQTFRTEMQGLRTEVQSIKTEVQSIKTEVQSIKTEVQDIKTRVETIETKVVRIEATQEIKVLPGLSLLAEGHENIVEHIQEKIDARADKLQDSIDVLNIAVKYHSEDIQELKKAQ